MIRCWVIDDEKAAHKGLALALKPHKDFQICKNFYAIDQLPESPPEDVDLIFLDIEMPRANGFSLFQKWQCDLPTIVFVTAYNQHALAAFEHQAFDYILKPIDASRFDSLITRLKQRFAEKAFYTQKQKLERLVRHLAKPVKPIKIQTDDGLLQLNPEDILCVEAVGDFVALTLKESSILTRRTLKSILNELQSLQPDKFVQIHRSYLVNIHAINKIEKGRFGDAKLELKNQQTLSVSRRYRTALLDKLK